MSSLKIMLNTLPLKFAMSVSSGMASSMSSAVNWLDTAPVL